MPLALHDVVVFVDYHEDNPESLKLWPVIHARWKSTAQLVRAHLETGDVMYARVVAGPATTTYVDDNVHVDGKPASTLLADAATTSLSIISVAERKTGTDLSNSLFGADEVPKEQHMDKQMIEMLEFAAATGARPYLLLEQFMSNVLTGAPIGMVNIENIHSFLINLFFVDGVTIWHGADTSDTARHIECVANKIIKQAIAPGSWVRQDPTRFVPRVVARKKRNRDPARYFAISLQIISGMSDKQAAVVVDKYKCVANLAAALRNLPSHTTRLAELADLRCNGRKLTKPVLEEIVNYYGPLDLP